jgi:hypothetical protein
MSFTRNLITGLCAVFFISTAGITQNIDQAITTYAEKYTPERVYIHYDKAGYSAGETIWFKAYLMSEILPADISKTLYVDWIDDKGVLLQHSVSPILNAVTNGQFDIPDDFKGKYIQVRAYTRWMLNFDSAFLYSKTLRIISKEPATSTAAAAIAPIPLVSFFPEGGDVIAGISTKIAFKANDQWGRPVKIKGIVINSQGKLIDSIRTIHDGMGYFFITPETGATYTAKWKDEKNVEHSTALPEAKSSGVALQVTGSGTNRYFNIHFTKDIADAMDTLHIVGTIYQHEAFRVSKPTNVTSMRATIPTGNLPSGILIITVLDKNWNALAERITFVNNEEYKMLPEMEVQHWGLNKRARNEIKITIPDSLAGNFSVSVTDAAIGTDSSSTIVSHLLLSSELKGEVYNPAYYFSNNSDSVGQHLDLVMLTNGWRRFKWEQVMSGRFPKPKYQRDTAYMSLGGKIYGVLPGQITPGTTIVMIVKQKDKQGEFLMEPLNADGTFSNPSILFDTAHIYYNFPKISALKSASVQFMPDRLPAPALFPGVKNFNLVPDTTGFYRQWLLVQQANNQARRLKVIELENVTVTSKTKSPLQLMDEKYASGLFIGDAYQFDLVNDPVAMGSINIFYYLQGKVAGLQVDASRTPPTLAWRGGSPQLYLDETPTDPDFISSVNVNDVAYIKVFRPPFMGGFNGANGAIAIYTRKGNDMKMTPGKGLSNNKVFGYTQIKEFYSPNYSSFSKRNEEKDLRTTLYWNPAVIINAQKRQAVLSFYNNDVSQAFRVIIEGITSDGKLAHLEQVME